MNNRLATSVLAALLIVAGAALFSCTDKKRPAAPYGFWDTGTPAVDSLLNRADTLDCAIDYDGELARAAYAALAESTDTACADPRLRAVARYTAGVLLEFDSEETEESEITRLDSMALAELADWQDSYLARRLRLDLACRNSDVRARTDSLYALLPYFTGLHDSLQVVNILYELNNSFGDIWDPSTQTDCFREIMRWAPGFVAPLRDIMQYNILAVERGSAPKEVYLGRLDSIAAMHGLLEASAPLGVIVYSDRYRLRGNPADLDTAGQYAEKLTAYHDALKSYWAQRLAHAMAAGDTAVAAAYASEIAARAEERTPMEIETLPVLLEYYRSAGDSAGSRHTNDILGSLRTRADAHEESNALASMRADRRISETVTQSLKKSRHGTASVVIALCAAAFAAAVLIWLLRRNRRAKNKARLLESQLLNTRRRLTVAELKSLGGVSAECPSWESFEAVFLEMHPDFADNLRRDFPTLTRNDIQLCALIRMDMDTKHIATILSIQPESAKKRFQRLRAKLGIPAGAPILPLLSRY